MNKREFLEHTKFNSILRKDFKIYLRKNECVDYYYFWVEITEMIENKSYHENLLKKMRKLSKKYLETKEKVSFFFFYDNFDLTKMKNYSLNKKKKKNNYFFIFQKDSIRSRIENKI